MTRDEKQANIIETYIGLVKSGRIGGALAACTGFGKTTVGVKIIQRLLPSYAVHVVVPTINLKDQWEKILEMTKIYNTKVYVVNSYLNLTPEERSCFFLILDEAHRYTNEEAKLFSTVLDRTSFNCVLPLSATFTAEQIEFMNSKDIVVFANVTIEEAAARGWVSRFIQYNLPVDLTDEELEKYTKASNIMKSHAPYIDGLDPFTANKDKQALWQHCRENGLDYKDVQMRLARFNSSNATRKAIIFGAENKAKICVELIKHIGKKSIVFSETKKFAEEVAEAIGSNAVLYHSTLSEKQKTLALTKIKQPEIKAICAPKALDEGIDIPELKCGIIASGTSVERQYVQRIGRVTRYVPNEIAIIINLYAKGTIEETWVKKRQKNSNNIRWIEKVTDISVA